MGLPWRKQKQETTCSRSGVLCETENRSRNNLWAWSPREAAGGQNDAANIFLGYWSASESVFAEIWDQIFQGFIDSKNVFFRRASVEDVTNLRSGSQMLDTCMCHVCHDVCGVCGEDWQVGHSEDKSNSWFKLPLYSSSFSSLSSALSIPNSTCSSATSG